MMFATILEVGSERHVCAVRFATREAADRWADDNDAEIIGWAQLLSLAEAAELCAHRTNFSASAEGEA